MAQHRSTVTCKLSMNSTQRKQGKEIAKMIEEWLDDYKRKKIDDSFINPSLARKYRIIRKSLTEDFMNVGDDLSKYINALPNNIWMLRIWNLEIILVILLLIILPSINSFFLKIETGIDVLARAGRGIDAIYVYPVPIYTLIIIFSVNFRGKRADAILRNLPVIRYILNK